MLGLLALMAPLAWQLPHPPTLRQSVTQRIASRASQPPAMVVADDTMKSVAEMKWVTGSGEVEEWDSIIENVSKDCKRMEDIQVHVGCDSAIQPAGRIIFAIVVCVMRPGHAGCAPNASLTVFRAN